MDETRTKKALDALADLYLTGVIPEPAPRQPIPNGAKSAESLDDLDGPPPIRLSPPHSGRRPPLRLRRDGEQVARVAVEQPKASTLTHRVEAVFMGNLPGFGGPWLTQYAHYLSKQRGPVAIVHLDNGWVDLELVGIHQPPDKDDYDQTKLSNKASVEKDSAATASSDLLEKLFDLSELRDPAGVRTWLIHLRSPGMTQAAGDLDLWTILSGVDEAAVVSSYRLLKDLIASGATPKRVALMAIGSEQAAAQQAAAKLTNTVQHFLGSPVELAGTQKQMEPVRLEVLGSFAVDAQTIWPGLRAFLGQLNDDISEELHETAAAPSTGGETAETVETGRGGWPVQHPISKEVTADRSERQVSATTQGREPARRPQPTVPADDLSTFTDEQPQLAALLDLGGVALQAAPPRHPQTQLLLDQEGRLHLLRRTCDGEELRTALLDLLGARRWVGEHLELIRLTQRQCRFEEHAEPVLHLFTDQSRAAVELAGQMGELLHLHLLQRVRIGSATTWVCTPLS